MATGPYIGETDEAAVGVFLNLIQADIEAHPGKLIPLDQTELDRLLKLVEGVSVDLDEVLGDDTTF